MYFSSENFNDVVNDANKESVDKINSVVDAINFYRLEGTVEFEVIQPLVLKIIKLID
jgi:hypothetical protein